MFQVQTEAQYKYLNECIAWYLQARERGEDQDEYSYEYEYIYAD